MKEFKETLLKIDLRKLSKKELLLYYCEVTLCKLITEFNNSDYNYFKILLKNCSNNKRSLLISLAKDQKNKLTYLGEAQFEFARLINK